MVEYRLCYRQEANLTFSLHMERIGTPPSWYCVQKLQKCQEKLQKSNHYTDKFAEPVNNSDTITHSRKTVCENINSGVT